MVWPRRNARPKTQAEVGRIAGFRSGLEEALAEQLHNKGIDAHYEELSIPFLQPAKPRKYSPDFILPNGIVVESKGQFVTEDRQKHLLVKQQHPDLDIRFVFSNPNAKIGKKSLTTYAKWCIAKGFQFAKDLIPEAWLVEQINHKSLAAIARLKEE